MYSNFKEQAIVYVKQAVQEDSAGNYAKAFTLYMNALEYFKTHLKYERDPEKHEAISKKFEDYLRRAEEIRDVLEGRPSPATSGGHVAVSAWQKTKPKDEEGEREDPLYRLSQSQSLKIKDGGSAGSSAASVGHGTVTAQPETSPKDNEGDGEDQKSKLSRAETINFNRPPYPKYSNFKEQAIEYVKQAVLEDSAGNYAKAFPLYMNALEYFKTHLKYENNPKIREAITQKFTEYLRRAEEIRTVLDYGYACPTPGSGHARPKDGESKFRIAIVPEKPNVKWSDVAGLERAKQALQEAIILPRKFSQFFTGKRQPWKAFLLYGPPGTGKSYLAKAVATEADSTFFSVSSSDLLSKWMGESEKLVSNLFQMARESAPSIIFIDEIDSLSGLRGDGSENEATRRVKTEILVQMQDVGTNDDKVFVLAATHTPYSIDQAIRRLFDKCIYIPLPDMKTRQHIFKVHLTDTPNNFNESDFECLAHKTEGFSGSDIAVCVKNVLSEHACKTQDAMFFVKTNEGLWVPCEPEQPDAVQITMQELAAQGLDEKISPPPITQTDFDKVLARQKATASKCDLQIYERFTKEFGEEG